MTSKLASELQQHDPLPRPAPWDLTVDVADLYVDTVSTNDDGRIVITTGYGRTFDFDPQDEVKFPRREHGQVIHWDLESDQPKAMQLCIGDIINEEWVVEEVRAHTPKTPRLLRIGLVSLGPRRLHWFVCDWLTLFPIPIFGIKEYVPQERVSARDRIVKPQRGPYVDVEHDDVFYTFLVHPTGKGRWDSGTPRFERKHERGEYVSRPPAKGSEWAAVRFAGSVAADRHPNDPRG